MKKRPIHINKRIVNAMLPDMPESFRIETRDLIDGLPYKEMEKPMKRKLSVGLVLVLVLALLVLSAIAAAMLTGKEFVGQILAPKVTETSSDRWSREELDEILRIANENGVTLSEDVRKRLEKADGEYKEELMRAFAKTELGFYPATWSIEDQAWYDKLLVQCGLNDAQTRFVPEGDEIQQDQALSIALAYIKDVFRDDADVTDTAVYRRFIEYRQFIDSDGVVAPKKWYISYEALDLYHNRYHFTILTDGTVEEAYCQPGLTEQGDISLQPAEVLDRYRDIYGNHEEWDMETWVGFHADLTRAAEEIDELSIGLSCILMQQYLIPDAHVIPRQTAIDVATSEISVLKGVPRQEIVEQWNVGAVLLMDEGIPVWKVTLTLNATEGFIAHLIEIDAESTDIRHVDNDKFGAWYEPYVLKRTLPDSIEKSVG